MWLQLMVSFLIASFCLGVILVLGYSEMDQQKLHDHDTFWMSDYGSTAMKQSTAYLRLKDLDSDARVTTITITTRHFRHIL
jgi:hypothetical protein